MKRPRVIVHAPRAGSGPGVREVEAHGETHALSPLGDAVNGLLYWEQPHVFRRAWRLISERGEHMLLHGQGLTRRKLRAETPSVTWTLDRSWTGDVTLADLEGRELASIPRGWLWRRRLELPDGPTLAWRRHWNGDRTLEDVEATSCCASAAGSRSSASRGRSRFPTPRERAPTFRSCSR